MKMKRITAHTPVRLSRCEVDVLARAAKGWTSKEIAGDLCVSKRTVDWHLNHAFKKLGARGRIDAIIRAEHLGLLPEASRANS